MYPLLFSLAVYLLVAVDYFFNITIIEFSSTVLWLCLLPIIYCSLFFRYFNRKFGRKAAYIISVLAVFTPAVVAITTDGYGALFYVINLTIIMFLSPMLGIELPFALFGVHVLGIILNFSGSLVMPNFGTYGLLDLLILGAAGLLGWLVFHRYYIHEQAEIERIRQILRSEQLRSEALIASLTDGVIIVDKRGIVQLCNNEALRMLGLDYKQTVSKHYLSILKHLTINEQRNTNDKITKIFEQALIDKKARFIEPLDIQSDQNDQSISLSCSLTPIMDEDAGVGALLLTLHDVSSYVHLQKLKDEFISTASHELRTPMTVIAGYSDLLLNPMFGELTDKQRGYVTRTKETAQQLIAIVNDMLDITKLESGSRPNAPEKIELKSFSEQFIDSLHDELQAANVTIESHLETIHVKLDKSRLGQVYGNILSNAIKFSPDGGHVTLNFVPHVKKSLLEVSVSDEGPGVPQELQSDIFSKFSRNKLRASSEKPGTGLGLAISRAIVEDWGGTINIESNGATGSRFYFTIPFKPSHEKKEKSS